MDADDIRKLVWTSAQAMMRRVWSSKRGGHNGSSASGQAGELRGLVRIPLGRVAALGDGALFPPRLVIAICSDGMPIMVSEVRFHLYDDSGEQTVHEESRILPGRKATSIDTVPGPRRDHMMIASPGHLGWASLGGTLQRCVDSSAVVGGIRSGAWLLCRCVGPACPAGPTGNELAISPCYVIY